MSPPPHGTYARFSADCRCEECKESARIYQRERKARLHDQLLLDPLSCPHGTVRAYGEWGCRCDPCKKAKRDHDAATRLHAQTLPWGDIPHGTAYGYCRCACRCERCCEANTESCKAYRLRRRKKYLMGEQG